MTIIKYNSVLSVVVCLTWAHNAAPQSQQTTCTAEKTEPCNWALNANGILCLQIACFQQVKTEIGQQNLRLISAFRSLLGARNLDV